MKDFIIDYSDFRTVYDAINDYDIATPGEIAVTCCFGGRTIETLNDLIYFKTGYCDIEDFLTSEVNDNDDSGVFYFLTPET